MAKLTDEFYLIQGRVSLQIRKYCPRSSKQQTSETSSTNNHRDSLNYLTLINPSQEVQHESLEQSRSSESATNQLSNRMGSSESSSPVHNTHQEDVMNQDTGRQEPMAEDEGRDHPELTYNRSNEWRTGDSDNMGINWQEDRRSTFPHGTTGNEGDEENHFQEAEIWRDVGSREAVENWSEGPSDPPRMRLPVTYRRGNRFHPPEDDNVYSMELRELLSR